MSAWLAWNPPQIQHNRRNLILWTPLVLIAGGQAAARLVGPHLGEWGWLALVGAYWNAALLLAVWGGGREAIRRWFRPSQGSRRLAVLVAAVLTAPAIPMLFPDTWRLLFRPEIGLATLLFVVINPLAEEAYWRGLILDARYCQNPWSAALISSALFAANHLWMGVLVAGARSPVGIAYQFLFGLLTSLVYLRTGSLRWPLLIHFLVNLTTPTVAIFLNLYIPGMSG